MLCQVAFGNVTYGQFNNQCLVILSAAKNLILL